MGGVAAAARYLYFVLVGNFPNWLFRSRHSSRYIALGSRLAFPTKSDLHPAVPALAVGMQHECWTTGMYLRCNSAFSWASWPHDHFSRGWNQLTVGPQTPNSPEWGWPPTMFEPSMKPTKAVTNTRSTDTGPKVPNTVCWRTWCGEPTDFLLGRLWPRTRRRTAKTLLSAGQPSRRSRKSATRSTWPFRAAS